MNKPYIRVYGGTRGIGGNQIAVIASNGKGLLLDFGIDLGLNKKYFEGFLTIRDKQALVDCTKSGLLPWPVGDLRGIYRQDLSRLNREWIEATYREYQAQTGDLRPLELNAVPIITGLLVSHAHIDHIGMIKYLRHDIAIYASQTTIQIMDRMEKTAGGSSAFKDLTQFKEIQVKEDPADPTPDIEPQAPPPENNSDDEQDTPSVTDTPNHEETAGPEDEDEASAPDKKGTPRKRTFIPLESGVPIRLADGGLEVIFWETDHSIPGAGAFWITDIGTGDRLIYTGDLRDHGPNGQKTVEFIRRSATFAPHMLVTEGTRLTPDPPEPEDILLDLEIDGRIDELPDEQTVRDRIHDFVARVNRTDPTKVIFFNCSARDLWRISTIYHVAQANHRKIVVDAKIYDMLIHLDPAGRMFNIDPTQVSVYLPRKDSGQYIYDDYERSPAIRQVFRLPEPEWQAYVTAKIAPLQAAWQTEVDAKMAKYEADRKAWAEEMTRIQKEQAEAAIGGASGKAAKKPKLPAEPKPPKIKPFKPPKFVPRERFWANPPFRVTAGDIHAAQGQFMVYLTPYIMNELFDIQPAAGSYYIHSSSGPFDEEGIIDAIRRDNWLDLFNIPKDAAHFGHFHCSGHMAEDRLFGMIEAIRPDRVVLIHSTGKAIFRERVRPPITALVPTLAEKYEW
jgi:mRNA degradation ribonuclease J1/J2